jgi:hypothetical protein
MKLFNLELINVKVKVDYYKWLVASEIDPRRFTNWFIQTRSHKMKLVVMGIFQMFTLLLFCVVYLFML